ncbi:MAG: lipopolysaccharide core heptose(I) kinase RfaP [Pseudomonadota bacterium]
MKKIQLELREDLQNYFADKDAFEEIMLLSGETVRKQQGRHTFRFSVMGKNFFIKQHRGVGWKEIIKNLLQLRLPILGASNEWRAIKRLHELGIDTMTLAGYGQRGKNPAKRESFVITDALENTTTLAVLVEEWIKNPPPVRLKYALIYKVAKITRALHENGINHRDLYICHFRLWVLEKQVFDDPPLFLMDLHRAQIRPKTPMRWIIKDLGALYFSSADVGLSQRDFFRFIKTYHDTDLRTVFSQYPDLWQKVQKRAKRFYRRDMRREMPVFSTPKKTIIVHLINLDTVGGVERLYCQVINANIKDVEHHTISCRNTIASVLWEDVKKASKSIHFEKKISALKVPKWPVFLRKKHLNNIMQKIVPDIVIVWNNPEGFDLSLLPLKTRVFYYEHGGAWNNHNPEKVYRFINNVSGIICNSQASQRLLALKWEVSRKVNYHICLNAIPPDCLPAEFNRKRFPFNRSFNLGVAARLVSYKGISLAIYAIKELKTRNIPCHLFIAGIGPEQRKLQSLTSQLDLENEVEFCNLVNNMSQFYQNIDCFLCPSIREPFGLVVAEAMAHGCPVIVAAVDGLPEVVTHDKNGFCIAPSLAVEQYAQLGGTHDQLPEYVYNAKTDKIEAPKLVDPIVLADNIQVLCSQPTLYESMSQAAVKSAETEFEFGNYINHFYAILRDDEVQGQCHIVPAQA